MVTLVLVLYKKNDSLDILTLIIDLDLLTLVVDLDLVATSEALGLQRRVSHVETLDRCIVEVVPLAFVRVADVAPSGGRDTQHMLHPTCSLNTIWT